MLVSQRAGFAFQNFLEPPITFPPTYKYIRFSSQYDQRPGKKVRAPAWCDRILYFQHDFPSNTKIAPIRVTEYNHVSSFGASDHKPVYARAVLLVKQYDRNTFEQLRHLALSKLQAGERHGTPSVQIRGTEASFGELVYASKRVHTVEIENVGTNNAYMRFLPRDSSNHIAPSFMHIQPLFAVIPPGETQSVTIELSLDLSAKRLLESTNGELDEMVAFRVDEDHDYYVHFTGHFLPTSFGASLTTLVRRLQPGSHVSRLSAQLAAKRWSIGPPRRSDASLASYG